MATNRGSGIPFEVVGGFRLPSDDEILAIGQATVAALSQSFRACFESASRIVAHDMMLILHDASKPAAYRFASSIRQDRAQREVEIGRFSTVCEPSTGLASVKLQDRLDIRTLSL